MGTSRCHMGRMYYLLSNLKSNGSVLDRATSDIIETALSFKLSIFP